MVELSPLALALLTLVGFAAGFVDSIAGGGGLLTVPALLAAGLPPHLALGTNKLQSSFGSLTATLAYRHSGLVRVRRIWRGILFTALGAALGTATIQRMSADFLGLLIPLLLAAIFVYMLRQPRVGDEDRRARLAEGPFYLLAGLGIGFYDGFFGPGTGSFWTILMVLLLGYNLKKATAHTKVVNFTSNAVALATFAVGGHVVLLPGLLMGLGQMSGAYLGSRLVIRRHAGFIRGFFLCVVGVTILKLLWERLPG
jgi:uncharacterized protein